MNSAISLPLNLCYSQAFSRKHHGPRSSLPAILSVLGTSRPGDDVLQAFIKERELSGDFIAKVSDRIWLRKDINSHNNANNGLMAEVSGNIIQSPQKASGEESESSGFLKLKRTNEWVLGDSMAAPANKKTSIKDLQNDSEGRKKINLLKYEALKRELLLLTVGIGATCGGYCLAVLSVEAALSYGIGVFFRIGIRSEDLQDLFERSVKGSGLALSSSGLVIPAAIYGLWELSQHFTNDLFDFQLLPAIIGMFAYKAAGASIQRQ